MEEKDKKNKPEILSWFEKENPYNDVVLSTRVRVTRNLADFPFVIKMTDEDKDRVKSLVYDCFSQRDDYSFINYDDLSDSGMDLLKDKNIISNRKCSAVVIGADESLSLLVNESDHVKIASFTSGLDCEKAMEKAYKLDEELQTKLQFAASFDFGYLTSRIKDCGSGMKTTLRIFIPSIVLSGQLKMVQELLKETRFCVKPVFAVESEGHFSNCLFDIFPGNAIEGTEIDQMATIQSIGMQILKTERKIRKEFADNNPTIVSNFFKQNFAKAMYSMLLDYEEAVSIISAVKWGLGLGLINGISDSELNALYYRTKLGHLKYLCNNFDFTFEDDIKNSIKLKVKRLRAIVIQQAFEGIVNEQPIS